jgi:hypothetical protein
MHFFGNQEQTKLIGDATGLYATGLNNLGHVVGQLQANWKASLWVNDDSLAPDRSPSGTDERFVDLHGLAVGQGVTSSFALGINDRDQIVGIADSSAALWQNGKFYRLNDLIGSHPDFSLSAATAISQNGYIAANTGNHAYLLLPIQFIGARLNSDGTAFKEQNGQFVFDRDLGRDLPQSGYLRINAYAAWRGRKREKDGAGNEIGSKDDENYGIKGILRSDKNQTLEQNTSELDPIINLDRMLFKIRIPKIGTTPAQKVRVTAYEGANPSQPIDLDLVDDPVSAGMMITTKKLLLYQDPNNQLATDAQGVGQYLSADTLLLKADKISIVPTTLSAQATGKFEPSRTQIYVSDGSTAVLEHDPVFAQSPITSEFQTSAPSLESGTAVIEPSSVQNRFFFWINQEDQTPDVRFEVRNADGSELDRSNAIIKWFLLFKCYAGNFEWKLFKSIGNNGTVFDVQEWHELPLAAANNSVFSLRDAEIIPDASLPVGDYQVFCRITKTGGTTVSVSDSNVIKFKILAKNPADAGRGIKDNPNATHAQLIPSVIEQFVNDLPNPQQDGLTFELHNWYKAILSQESGFSPFSYRQDFDNFERVPELGGVDRGFQRSVQNTPARWYARFAFPLVGYDNGWGISQQTQHKAGPTNPRGDARDTAFENVTRWKTNITAGWDEFAQKLQSAATYLKGQYQTSNLSIIPQEYVIREAVKRYNGGTQYRRVNNQVIEQPTGITPSQRGYVATVAARKAKIDQP